MVWIYIIYSTWQLKKQASWECTLVYRFPDSVREIFPGPATIQTVYQGINGFPAGRATTIDSFEHVD